MSKSGGLLLIFGAVVGVALGYALTRSGFGSGSAVSAETAGQRVREILAGNDPLQRAAELAALFPRLGPDAVPAVTAAYDAAALDGGDTELVLLATWWARFDPEAAHRWTSSDWRAAYGSVLGALFRSWARSEPEKAWNRALALTFAGHRELATDAAITGWDESGQPGLVEFVRALPAGPPQQRVAEVLARRRVVSLGAQGALRWVEELPDDEFKTVLLTRIASSVARADARAAAAWAEPQIAAAKRPTGLPRRIGTRWIHQDPQATLAWLASLPAGEDRNDGVTESFRDWLKRDPAAARAWIESTEMEAWNEPAFGLYARSAIAYEDPLKALQMVARITDQPLRDYLTTVIARAWLERDRDAADAWIQQADLPEGVRERAYMVSRRRPRAQANANAATAQP
jgi:hypothetical protein